MGPDPTSNGLTSSTAASEGLYPPDKERRQTLIRADSAFFFSQGLLDLSAEAGERSERKPGVVTPRDGLHKVKQIA